MAYALGFAFYFSNYPWLFHFFALYLHINKEVLILCLYFAQTEKSILVMDAYNVNTIYIALNISDSGIGIARQINHKTYSLTTCSDYSQGHRILTNKIYTL